ncbi:hypothetical protein C8258_17660 [Nocardia sp. MDA0666]|nr:hypothetical protein C8258_17660 [Nocardia sp. MDA0666]
MRTWTVVGEKRSIARVAREMVSDVARLEPARFEVELVAGRALRDEGEFVAVEELARRWVGPVGSGTEYPERVTAADNARSTVCPYVVDVDAARPDEVPPLLFNLRLHAGHGCRSEITLARICRERGHLAPD